MSNSVGGCTLRRFGRVYFAFRAGVSCNGTGVLIEGNEISYSPYAAITPGKVTMLCFSAVFPLV